MNIFVKKKIEWALDVAGPVARRYTNLLYRTDGFTASEIPRMCDDVILALRQSRPDIAEYIEDFEEVATGLRERLLEILQHDHAFYYSGSPVPDISDDSPDETV